MAVISATNFIPEVWKAAVYRTLEDNLVAKLVAMDHSSEISKFGDTIHFNGISDPAVAAYDGTAMTYEKLTDSRITMNIDRMNKYSFAVDDVEQAMANVDLKGSQSDRAAYQLAKTCDTYLFGSTIYGDATGGTITNAAVDSSNIFGIMSKASRLLDEANVPANEKWIVIAPWIKERLENAGVLFSINEGISGKGGLSFAQYRDLKVYVTNNLTNLGSTATPQTICLAGSAQAIGFAEKIMKVRAMEDIDTFAAYMSGLQVFGAKVIKPKELVKLDLTLAEETDV